MNRPIRILLAEDSEDDALLLEDVIKKGGYAPEMRRVEDPEAMVAALEDGGWDMVLCDYAMPSFNGLDALNLLKNSGHDLPFIIVSGAIGEETAVGLMKDGAHDYVFKGNLARLVPVIERELQEAEVRSQRQKAEEALREKTVRLSKAQRIARMGFLDWNLKTNRMQWSEEVYRLCGIDPEMETGDINLTMQLVHPEDREFVKKNLDMAIRGVKKYDIDYRKLRPDGSVIWVHAQAELIRDADGNPDSLLGTVVDITERKQAEEALRKTTEELGAEREELSEKNLVLKYILEHIEGEREEYKQQICQDVEQVVLPVLARLQEKVDPSHAGPFEALQDNLKAILAKDVDVFRERYAKLTPRELEICDMIKEGFSSKEMSESLNLSLLTVHKHREDIRKKLGITNKNVNLGTYLRVR